MSMDERSGKRSLTYSAWHRPNSIRRFLGIRVASWLTVIDIDWCEYCGSCKEPVALIETQEGNRPPKDAPVMRRLAEKAGIPAYSVSYVVEDALIVEFRCRELVPGAVEQRLSEQEYADFLVSLRCCHSIEKRDAA